MFDRFYYLQGEDEFCEPSGTVDDAKLLLQKYISFENILNNNYIKVKIFIGKTIM